MADEGATERETLETGADDEGLALETGADETGAGAEGEGAALETGATGEGDAEGVGVSAASPEGAGVSSSSGAALRHSVLEPAMTLTGEVADVSPVLSVTMMVLASARPGSVARAVAETRLEHRGRRAPAPSNGGHCFFHWLLTPRCRWRG